jgi:hypothetical protein
MKIVEAMKKVKDNRRKIDDLRQKIAKNAARLSYETSQYDNPEAKVKEWLQSCNDLSVQSVDLLERINKTNINTIVEIEIGGKSVSRSIAGWIYRRREFAAIDAATWKALTDNGLKDGFAKTASGDQMEVKVVRHFNPEQRDRKISEFSEEPYLIDSRLEVINAITDLAE